MNRLFFFNDTATTEIYTLSLHDALPISRPRPPSTTRRTTLARARARRRRVVSESIEDRPSLAEGGRSGDVMWSPRDRKSTRLNSSHANISYAVFCLKKKHVPHHSTLQQQ